jgi:hypothetical protein
MFPVWFILGIITIFAGVFSRQTRERLGSKPNSEVFTNPSRKRSSTIIEQIGRWLTITLGVSFLVLGLGGALPNNLSYRISFLLLGLAGLMLLAIIGITIANWKAKS